MSERSYQDFYGDSEAMHELVKTIGDLNVSTKSLVLRKPCGCVVMLVVDSPRVVKDSLKDILECIREGCTVVKMPVQDARALEWRCPMHQFVDRVKER